MGTKRCLIVDDDEDLRKVVQATLQITTDWDILTAGSGREALILAQSEHLDAILLDVMMPDLNGIETLRELQAHRDTQAIPVIFFTAKVLSTDQREMQDLEIQGIIAKPFNATILHKQIIQLLHW